MIAFLLSMQIFGISQAENNILLYNITSKNETLTSKPIEVKITDEIISKRTKYDRHFEKDDGTFLAKTYPQPINFIKEGKWEHIDNTLKYDENEQVITNTSNSFKVKFKNDISSEKLVEIQKDKYSMSWDFKLTNHPLQKSNATILSNDTKSDCDISSIEELNSQIVYKSIIENIDLRYSLNSDSLKEDIIIKSPIRETSFSFKIKTHELEAILNADNTISFLDSATDLEVFKMDAPYMYDSSYEVNTSKDIDVVLEKVSNDYILTIVPNYSWINSEGLKWPIYIDPTVFSDRISSTISDTYVHSGDIAGEHTTSSSLRFGKISGIVNRAFIKTGIPTITNGTVYNAKLILSNTSGSSTFNNIDVYRVNTSWLSSSLTWATHSILSKTLIKSDTAVSAYTNNPSSYRYSCDVTDTVQDFYINPESNYGFMIRYTNEGIADYNAVYSSDCGTSVVMPYLEVSYVTGETLGIKNNEYYYIKNFYTDKYLEIQGSSDANGAYLIQNTFTGNTNQQFSFSTIGNGCYKIFPRHSTTSKVVDLFVGNNIANGDINGTRIGIWSQNGGDNQEWILTRINNSGEYKITSKCGNTFEKGLAVHNNNQIAGEYIHLWQYTPTFQDWITEPVDTGDADYFFTARIFSQPTTNAPISTINNMNSDLSTMNYSTYYYDNATANTVYNYLPYDKIATIHGHGSAGSIQLLTNNGTEHLYSASTPNGNDRSMINYSNNQLSRIRLLTFLSCNSGTDPSNGESLVDMAYSKGANCVIGFNVSVAGAEFWYEYALDYIRQGQSIYSAMVSADYAFKASYTSVPQINSPAFPENRVVAGNTVCTINLNR